MFLLPVRSRCIFFPLVVHKYQKKVVFEIFTSGNFMVGYHLGGCLALCSKVSAASVFIFPPSTCILAKFIYQSSAIHTFQNFSFVVISHGSAEFFVGHAAVVFLFPP